MLDEDEGPKNSSPVFKVILSLLYFEITEQTEVGIFGGWYI